MSPQIETHKNGSDGKDWVWITHPDIPAEEPAEVTLESFQQVWEDRGFKIVDAPSEEVASNQESADEADETGDTAAPHGRGKPKAKAKD